MGFEKVEIPDRILLDADVFISFLTGDQLFPHSIKIIESIIKGFTIAYVSSEIYDDIVSMLRSNGISFEKVIEFMESLSKIPHRVLPLNTDIVIEALRIYSIHRGSRKLHYFDSYHVAVAKYYKLPLVTSDRYIIRHHEELGVEVIDLRTV